jgi:hypothetical protein
MYSASVNKHQLQIANQVFQKIHPKHELVYHSEADVLTWREHLETLRGKDGTFSRDLTVEEDRWITNERMVCKIDHRYALRRYSYIIDRNKKLSLFSPNLAQKIILATLGEMEEQRVELILQFVKARRLGVSTIFELLIALRILFDKNINAIISASNPEDTDVLSRMCLLAIERFPFWMRPLSTHLKDSVGRFKQGLFYEFHFGLSETSARNRIDLEHGTQFADIGRSQGPTANHLTEIAKYSNAGSLIDAGLMKAMIPSPMNLCCLEGTSEGPTGYWPEKYDFNKKNYGIPGSGSRMRPTFLPWFCGIEIYPTPTDLITKGWYQVCDTWEPDQKTIDHARHAREYVLSDPMLKKFLAKGQDDWQMSREQQFFFEADIKEYRKNNNLHIWLREMAPDDRSCWAAGEKSVFNADMLMKYRDATTTPKAVFGLKGKCGVDDIIAKRHHILGALHKLKSLKVTADWTKRYAPFEFEFYPVKFTGWNGFDETGKIIIFEWPKPGETYALAADNADGRGGDSSVLKVLRKGGMGRCDAEVASFASSGISGTELWPWTLALGTLYSVMRDGKLQQPVFIPEINREGGGQLVKEMDYRGWKNFYRERRGRATSRGKGTIMLGWHMNEQNRAELILRGIQAIEDEWIEINSPAVVDEMDVFIRHPNGRIAASKHRHDDHIISMFLGFWALYHDQVRGTGPDPTIQRSRPVSDDAMFPLAEEGIGSQISRHIDEVISERGWSL